MLDQGNTHRCRDNRGHGRDVDGLVAVSAGADDVESAAGQVDAGRVILHAVGQAVNLLDGGALIAMAVRKEARRASPSSPLMTWSMSQYDWS